MLPEGTKQKLDEITRAYNAYSQTIEGLIKTEQAVQAAVQKRQEAEQKAAVAEKSRIAYQGALTNAEKELKKYKDVTEALEEQTEATRLLKKAEQELNDAKKNPNTSEKTLASKTAKVEASSERKQKADTIVEAIDPKRLAAQEAAVKKVATATEKFTAAKKEAINADRAKTQAEAAEINAIERLSEAREQSANESAKEAQALTKLRNALGAVNPAYRDLALEGETAEEQLENLQKVISGLTEDELKKLRESLNSAGNNFDNFSNEIRETGGVLDQVKQKTQEADTALGQKEALEGRIKQFLGLSGAATVMRHALRDAMSTITELDETMTEMAVVTDLTVGDYWDQLPEYSKRASELGVSINSAYKAATLYYQQGLKTNEVNAISVETLKMAKIAGMDAAEATDKMTAALRGFNMELNEASAQKVSDVYSELAAITAADTKEIANAMTKTASIAHSAGMEFETTAAFLAQIVETTRESAETAGTAMKTVIARFQELKKDPADIGEVDGEIVDANQIETALRSVGVSLRDTSGQFRELDDVFLELSSKWDGLDKNTQRYIATIAAGSRQQSRFIAMMSDYGRTQELVTAANNSSGASNKQFEKTMDSLEAKLEKLKNAWHEFTMGILNSDVVKAGVDILTKFLEVINKITAGFGDKGIAGGLTKIMSVLSIFKLGMKIFEKFKQPVIALFAEIAKQAGLSGEKSAKEYAAGIEREKNAKLPKKITVSSNGRAVANISQPTQGASGQSTQKTVGQAILSGERVYDNSTGTGKLMNAGVGTLSVGARALGIDQFAKVGELQKQKVAADTYIKTNDPETLAANLNKANENVATAQEGKQKATEKAALAQARKKAADENMARLKGGAVDKQSDEWKEAAKAQKAASKAVKDANKSLEEQEQILKTATEEQEIASDAVNTYNDSGETLATASKKQWKAVSDGCSAASGALMGVGMGLGMVGSAFESLGMEEAANSFNTAAQIFSTAGAVLGIFPPLLTLIQTLFPGVGAASAAAGGVATASGDASSAAWSVVGVIVLIVLAAIIATVAIILVVMSIIQKNSPAQKLKEMEAAADGAADTAEKAAEAYEHLNSALEELDDKYKALDDLTRGTEEWNEAVKDINQSVLDLINEYPELAKFVENKKGVLTIDVNSAGVQEVLAKAETTKVNAANTATAMKLRVQEQRDANEFAKLNGTEAVAKQRGWQTAGNWLVGSTAAGTGIGTATGAGASLAAGPFAALLAGPLAAVGAGIGAATGLVVGAIGGAIAGPIAAAGAKTDEKLQEATEALALSVANGDTEKTFEDMFAFLKGMDVAEDEARAMAEAFAKDSSELEAFADSLKETNEMSKAYYESMAMQAEQLANTAGWTTEEVVQGQNLIDDDVYKAMEKQAEDAVGDLKLNKKKGEKGLNNMNAEQERLLDEAIEQIYGENAKREGKKVIFTNENNETVTEKLAERETEILEAMKQIKATELTSAAMEGTKSVIATLNKQMGGDIASRLYNDSTGGSLTMADVKALGGEDGKLDNTELQAYWNKLNDKEKQVYGNSFAIFSEDFSGINDAAEAIADVKSKLEELGIMDVDAIIDDNVSKNAAIAMGEQFKSIAEKLASQNLDASAITKEGGIADQYKQIYASVDEELKDDLSAQFASLDTSTIESLNRFQWELVNVYGVSADEAALLTNSIKDTTLATSAWTVTVDQFGALEAALESINKLVNEMTKLQWEYNRALEEGIGNIDELLSAQIDNIMQQSSLNAEAYAESQKNLAIQYARGATASSNALVDFRDYVTMNANGTYDVDQAKAQQDAEAGTIDFDEFSDWLDSLDESYESMLEYEQAARDAYDSLVELEKQAKEAYYDLREMAKEAVLDKMQKQIDLQEQTLEATEEANNKIISKIQEQIDDTRQARENKKAEENITKLRSQAAYLAMDTSGMNSLSVLQTEEQIAQAEESYQDSLVDQAIQQLEDANAKAAEQRERQIVLAEAQLEAYQNSALFQQHIDSLMTEALSADSITNTTLGDLLSEYKTAGMTAKEKEDWAIQLQSLTDQAKMYTEVDWKSKQKEAYENITTIADSVNVMLESTKAKTANQHKNIQQQGFSGALSYDEFKSDKGTPYGGGKGDNTSYGTYEAYLENFDTFMRKEGNTKTEAAEGQRAEMENDGYEGSDGNGVKSQSEYNASVADRVAKGEDVATYNEYVSEQFDKYKQSLRSKHVSGKDGWFPVKFDGWNGFKEGSNEGKLDIDGAGKISHYIGFGSLVSGAKADFLKQLMKDTYSADQTAHKLNDVTAETPTGHAQGIYYGGKAYAYFDGAIREIVAEKGGKNQPFNVTEDTENGENIDFTNALKARNYIQKKYKTGGLADFTGPAWLDGTKSKPEIVLNQRDSANFIQLRDILSEAMDSTSGNSSKKPSGDNYFDIDVNVEKIDNDYDVEQIANKIRRMIYEDASYRNVNAINLIR